MCVRVCECDVVTSQRQSVLSGAAAAEPVTYQPSDNRPCPSGNRRRSRHSTQVCLEISRVYRGIVTAVLPLKQEINIILNEKKNYDLLAVQQYFLNINI